MTMKTFKNSILISALFMVGCNSYQFNCKAHTAGGGVSVCFENEELAEKVFPSRLDAITQITEEETQVRYPNVTNLKETLKKNDVTIFFTPKQLVRNCMTVNQNDPTIALCEDVVGVNYHSSFIVIDQQACRGIFNTVGHELLHSIEGYYFGDDKDTSHTLLPMMFNQPLKTQEEKSDTIETHIMQRVTSEICI